MIPYQYALRRRMMVSGGGAVVTISIPQNSGTYFTVTYKGMTHAGPDVFEAKVGDTLRIVTRERSRWTGDWIYTMPGGNEYYANFEGPPSICDYVVVSNAEINCLPEMGDLYIYIKES